MLWIRLAFAAAVALGAVLLPSSTCACEDGPNVLLEPTGSAAVQGGWTETHWGYAEMPGSCAEGEDALARQVALKHASSSACTGGSITGHAEGPMRQAELGGACVTEVAVTWSCG